MSANPNHVIGSMGTGHGPTRVTPDEARPASKRELIEQRERWVEVARNADAEVARLDALIEQAPEARPKMTEEQRRALFAQTQAAADMTLSNKRRVAHPD
jgi:hypothetical protein